MSILRCEEVPAKRRRDFGVPRREDVALCARLLDRAIKTLRALPDRGHRNFRNAWPGVVRDARDAYGYTELKAQRFRPTPHDISIMLDVLGWITWLENNNGRREAKVIVWRAFEVPWWIIAENMGREKRTIQRWYDGGVTRIYAKFGNAL